MKLHNLTLENFRSFDRYAVNHLGRVNLLVGTNNSGKTSILEAIGLISASRKFSAMWNLLTRRGEIYTDSVMPAATVEVVSIVNIRHLFPGHMLSIGSNLSLAADADHGRYELRASVKSLDDHGENGARNHFTKRSTAAEESTSKHNRTDKSTDLFLGVSSIHPAINNGNLSSFHLSLYPGLTSGSLLLPQDYWTDNGTVDSEIEEAPWFVSASSINSGTASLLHNSLDSPDAEKLIVEALNVVDDKIERVAAMGNEDDGVNSSHGGGFVVHFKNHELSIPLGSLGEGVWRMLGLALAVVHSQDKILLIDEIDTGLHYSLMGRMWQFLNDCSERFNIQIIATTHSRDCYQSLAEICEADRVDPAEVTIQRIDRKRNVAVAYSEAAIIAAAENDVEVR